MSNKISVVMVDDHPIVLDGFKTMLQDHAEIELQSSYLDVRQLIDDLQTMTPEVLILDIKMPGMNGEELADHVARHYPAVKMIALTYLDSLYYAKLMMRKGVLGYVLKSCNQNELISAIKTVHNNELYVEASLKDRILQQALLQRKQSTDSPVLTKRELEILQLIASNYNSFEIAQKLFISKRTVENHRANMLLKLKVKNAPALIKKAIELNLL